MKKIAINGFGRIGRLVFRIIDKNKIKSHKAPSNEISLGIIDNEKR